MTSTLSRQTIVPASDQDWLKLRTQDITSTDIAALFGISPYMTAFELWHRKRNADVVTLEPNDRMVWGTRLESAIAFGIAADNGWAATPMKEYLRLPDQRIGSSFDFRVDLAPHPSGPMAILEVKNVDSLAYKEGWLIDGDSIEAPAHIELQLQHQLLVSGFDEGIIGALIGGNRVTLIRRKADLVIQESILRRVAEFWYTVDNNIEPKPDFSKDANFIISLAQYAEPGKVMDATGDIKISSLVKEYKEWGEKEAGAQKQKVSCKAQLLELIGDNEKVVADWGSISARLIGEKIVEAYPRKAYRDFRVHVKEPKI